MPQDERVGIICEADGVMRRMRFTNATFLALAQDAVHGLIEAIDLPDVRMTVWCNEEYRLKEPPWPVNVFATAWWHMQYQTPNVILGPVVITGPPDAEGETTGLAPAVIHVLMGVNRGTGGVLSAIREVTEAGLAPRMPKP